MPSWSELRREILTSDPPVPKADSLLYSYLSEISKESENKNVIIYASAFLQKPGQAGSCQISREDMNGFMNVIKGMDCKQGLILILHTPGGEINAVASIVNYLHEKFSEIEVIVPYMAMSGGSMIALASDKITMGKPSIIGPTDPQFVINNVVESARRIIEMFDLAKKEIEENPALANIWAPLLPMIGPSTLLRAQEVISYSRELLEDWLLKRELLKDVSDKKMKAKEVAEYFNAENKVQDEPSQNKPIRDHGQGIRASDIKKMGLAVNYLEKQPSLQENVMSIYHIMTIIFENTPSLKFIAANGDEKKKPRMWAKAIPHP